MSESEPREIAHHIGARCFVVACGLQRQAQDDERYSRQRLGANTAATDRVFGSMGQVFAPGRCAVGRSEVATLPLRTQIDSSSLCFNRPTGLGAEPLSLGHLAPERFIGSESAPWVPEFEVPGVGLVRQFVCVLAAGVPQQGQCRQRSSVCPSGTTTKVMVRTAVWTTSSARLPALPPPRPQESESSVACWELAAMLCRLATLLLPPHRPLAWLPPRPPALRRRLRRRGCEVSRNSTSCSG